MMYIHGFVSENPNILENVVGQIPANLQHSSLDGPVPRNLTGTFKARGSKRPNDQKRENHTASIV